MDIIDVLVAKALTPQGQIESYAAQAQAAVSSINSITAQTNTNNTNAAKALADANAALAALEAADYTDIADVDAEVKKLILSISNNNTNAAVAHNIITTYPDNTTRTLSNIVKYYKTTGNNEDGTMTQKAITAALAAIPSSGGSSGGGSSTIQLDPEDKGQLTVVDDSGNIIASGIMADDIANFLIKNDLAFIKDTVGLKIDYVNKTFTRTQDATRLRQGSDFDSYAMYGGRKRCNVSDNGAITAFYGDNNYRDDGSNGQVMVYQPKFYYSRITLDSETVANGEKIKQEIITISSEYKPGFKIHPLFVNDNEEVLDYVLLSAYESSAYDISANSYNLEDSSTIDYTTDKLSSIANAKPISGVNKTFNIEAAERMAQNRGTGWHITNMAAESANQMLEAVEFGTLNSQAAFENGITKISNVTNANCASNTGSTASLGNSTGYAASTTNIINGNTNNYINNGRRAISYRGIENPWGNIWRYIKDMKVIGNGSQQGGKIYIRVNETDIDLFAQLPSSNGYSSYFQKINTPYDWMFIPIENSGNSALPIGDQLWTTSNLNGINSMVIGGRHDSGEEAGPFSYACDKNIEESSHAISARLMFIPIKNNIYNANITKWQANMEV